MSIQLIEHLPPFMRDFAEIQHITNAEQPEFDNLLEYINQAYLDITILTATEKGIKHWENVIGVRPKDTETLEERRFRVMTMLNQELPYTVRKLHETLTVICGAENYAIDLQPQNYHIDVKLGLANANNYDRVVELLNNVIPANLTRTVSIQYTKNSVISRFTHSQLKQYTHHQLRSEVFES